MSSFTESYDRHRPRPPAALLDLLCLLAGVERPRLVVDLGSGTGLSSRAWVGRAERVVGIEPHAEMRAVAEAQGGAEYVDGDSGATGLPDACADLVTCSQSLHWMEPEPTFAEAARILRPDGVFAAYDCDAAPVIHPEVDAAVAAVHDRAQALRHETGRWGPWTDRPGLRKSEHLSRMRASGRFRFAREFVLHSVEEGDADRVVGLVRSFGGVATFEHEDIGLEELRTTAERVLGERSAPFWFGYRVRIGVV